MKNLIFATVLLVLASFPGSPALLARPPQPTPTPTPRGEDRGNSNSAAENVSALNLATTGPNNTAHGWYSLSANTGGTNNTANGFKALSGNTTGADNTALGDLALQSNTTGSGNVAIGAQALASSTATGYNADLAQVASVAIGYRALTNATGTGQGRGDGNTAVGDRTLESNTDGSYNNAFGVQALKRNTTGAYNIAVGSKALESNNGYYNVAVGHQALLYNTTGSSNVAVGWGALETAGFDLENSQNTAIGNFAGAYLLMGSGNVYIGAFDFETVFPNSEYNHTYIRNINTTSVSGGGTDAVTVDLTTGLLGHLTSSRRHKEEIKAMDNASETLYRLKPVTYRYKKEIDRNQALDYGLIAEEVAEIDPNLAVRNKDGDIETVRYNAINIMLLNEFLKEHKRVEQLQETVAQQRKDFEAAIKREQKQLEATRTQQQNEIEVLTATLKEQAAQIQKVSVQVEVNRAAPKVVTNR